jgi:hypothetical protein
MVKIDLNKKQEINDGGAGATNIRAFPVVIAST